MQRNLDSLPGPGNKSKNATDFEPIPAYVWPRFKKAIEFDDLSLDKRSDKPSKKQPNLMASQSVREAIKNATEFEHIRGLCSKKQLILRSELHSAPHCVVKLAKKATEFGYIPVVGYIPKNATEFAI